MAEEASSPAARRAHLELAFRYVKAAEELYLSTAEPCETTDAPLGEAEAFDAIDYAALAPALKSAFPFPSSGAFSDLLEAIT